jgi:hypothetical protein
MRWKGNGLLQKRGHTIFYNSDEKVHQFGTGFVAKNLCKHLVIDFIPINPRTCNWRVGGHAFIERNKKML